MPSSTPATPAAPRRLSGAPAFAVVAAVVGLALAASATPTPLYGIYQDAWQFSSLTLTLVYATYCLGVLAALLVAGSVSDQAGRRPVLIAALGGLIASSALFALADSVVWLYAARLLQGAATGVALSTAGAAMLDLHPRGDDRRVGLVTAFVSGAGISVGALATAALVEHGPAPRVLPFALLGALFAVALAATLLLPEPVAAPTRPTLRIVRPHVPAAIRGAFTLSALGVLASWSISGLYLSLGPRLASDLLDAPGQLAGAVAIVVLTLPGLFTQLRWRHLAPRCAASRGSVALAVGLATIVLSLSLESAALYLLGSAVAGAGWGVAYLGALQSLTAVAPPAHRAGVMSALYVAAYLSLAVPAIAAGLVVESLGLASTFRLFGALVAAVAVLVAVLAARQPVATPDP